MQENDLISIVVPVYNTEQYLSSCVFSVLNQQYGNFELILVDDGSTDKSAGICDEFADKDSRIKVIHKKNGGLSSARNEGVKAASGKYICFIDSDDIVSNLYLSTLYENAVRNCADVSFCSFCEFCEDAPEFMPTNDVSHIVSKEDLLNRLTTVGADCVSTSLVVAWNKLIRTEIAKKIYFPLGKWHEDEFYINYLLENADVFVETDAPLYFYRKRDDSIVGINNQLDIRHIDILDAFEERITLYHRLGDNRLYKKIVSSYRTSIIIQYHNFQHTPKASELKNRFLKSFFKYKSVDLKAIKGYLLFLINSVYYYKKYWKQQ